MEAEDAEVAAFAAYQLMQRAMMSAQTGTDDESQAISAVAGQVAYTVNVTASFDLKAE